MNQTFSTTVDVPDGYEATGEYRQPAAPDIFLTTLGTASTCQPGIPMEQFNAFILRRGWTPPTWLPVDNWLYFNGENWILSNREPRPQPGYTHSRAATGAVSVAVKHLATIYGQVFTPPTETSQLRVYRL